jgi:hypothetical protein
MTRYQFSVAHLIVTQESAEHGECDESQSDSSGPLSLRDAVKDLFQTRTAHCDGISTIEGDHCAVTVYNGMEYLTGAYENRTLFIPPNVSKASARRLAKLLGVQS